MAAATDIPRGARRLPSRGRAAIGLILLGLVTLGISWSMSSQPFSAPDEASHYLRAMTLAHGALLGHRARYPATGIPAPAYRFASHDTRSVYVAAKMSPGDESCNDGTADTHGCTEVTPTGDYYPLAYALPAIGLKLSGDATTALWWARILSLLPCLVLIGLGLLALWDGTGWSLLGGLASLTPMALFVTSILNPSGFEVAANFAFLAALLRLTRDRGRGAPKAVWALAVAAGVLMIVSYQSGPISAAFDLLAAAGLLGAGGVRELVSEHRARTLRAAAALVAAVVLWAVYSKISGVAHSQFGIAPVGKNLNLGLSALQSVLQDGIGTFGSLTIPLSGLARWLWWAPTGALVLLAIAVGSWRERVTVALTTLVVLVYPVLFFAWVYRLSGYALQGRQVLPLLMLIPLVSGEVVHRNRARFAAGTAGRWIGAAVIAGIGVFQGYAWWYNARSNAGATAYLRFYAHATWHPPTGWTLWIVLALAGTVALLVAAALSAVRPPAPSASIAVGSAA